MSAEVYTHDAVREFGGYLPLELPVGREYFEQGPDWNVRRLNSARSAIHLALKTLGVRRVFYPRYYCPSTIDAIRSFGYELVEYPIGFDLEPRSDSLSPECDDAVILVDYYGILGERLLPWVERYSKVIIDNAQSFFARPVCRRGVITVNSCRKFFGVSDGAYAISADLLSSPDWELDESASRIDFLAGQVERGSNAYYEPMLKSKVSLAKSMRMSAFTRRVLASIDYEWVRAVRLRNYQTLHEELGDIQELEVPDSPISPWCYPLLTDRILRRSLVARRVYVPRIWETWDGMDAVETPECVYSNYLTCLPIDQRYGVDDMQALAAIVREEWDCADAMRLT